MPAYFAAIDGILRESVRNQLAPEFMAPPAAKRMEPGGQRGISLNEEFWRSILSAEISVYCLGLGAMRLIGEGIWGPPKD
jgi:hypothetical protein